MSCSTAHLRILLLLALAVVALVAQADGLETRKFSVLTSASSTTSDSGTVWNYGWNATGQWQTMTKKDTLQLDVNSNYRRDTKVRADNVRIGLRLMPRAKVKVGKWQPVYLAQSEGDHRFNKALFLFAYGARATYKQGYLELTAGASKDLSNAGPFKFDIGLQASLSRQVSPKLKVGTGPKVNFASEGEFRLRDKEKRYSWDFNADYKLSDTMTLSYRLTGGNTDPRNKGSQMIGLRYTYK
jgi:hypothetical protein